MSVAGVNCGLHHTNDVFEANVRCKGIVMAYYSEKRCLQITKKQQPIAIIINYKR
jgi:hypothetical protein